MRAMLVKKKQGSIAAWSSCKAKTLPEAFWTARILVFFYRHKWLGPGLLLIGLSLSLWGIWQLEIESDSRKFLPQNTAERRANQKIQQLYNVDTEIIIAYRSISGEDVLSSKVMKVVERLSNRLLTLKRNSGLEQADQTEPPGEEDSDLLGGVLSATADSDGDAAKTTEPEESRSPGEGLVQDVQSLTTASIMRRTTAKQGNSLELQEIGPLALGADGQGLSQSRLEQLKEELHRWGIYERLLYSEDFRYGAIILQPQTGLSSAGHLQLYREVVALLGEFDESGLRFFLSGEGVVQSVFGQYILRDLIRLVPLLLLIIFAVLYWYFRRVSALLIILFPVMFAVLLTIGLMGWLGIQFTFIHASIPVLVMALGSADSIHTLNRFRQHGSASHGMALLRPIISVQRQLLLPITLTSVTTGIGFLSFAFSVMLPVRSFGLFSALGIALSWLASIFIAPLLLPLYGGGKRQKQSSIGADGALSGPQKTQVRRRICFSSARLACGSNRFLLRYPRSSCLLLLLFSSSLLLGIPYIPVDNDTISYFHPKASVVQDSTLVNRELGGIYGIHISLRGPEPGAAANPRILQYMAGLAAYVRQQNPEIVRKSIGLQDFVTQLNQLLNPGAVGIPDTQESTVQYLSLYSGNLDNFVSPDVYEAQDARLSFYLNSGSKDRIQKVLTDIDEFKKRYLPEAYSQLESGYSITVKSMNHLVVREQIRSIMLALAGVFLVVLLSFRSLRLGLLACLPPTVTLLLNFALMALLRIDLNISTALINSLVIGVGIDYSIHLISAWQNRMRKYSEEGGVPASTPVMRTLEQLSSSILLNAVAVGLGYATLIFSQFRSLSYFGWFSSLASFVAALISLLILPMLLVFVPAPVLKTNLKTKGETVK